MNSVHVSASKEYDVIIGQGLLDQCGELVKKSVKADTVALVAGSNVFPLYGEKVTASLEKAGFRVVSHVIPAGEEYKSLSTFTEIIEFFAQNHLTRSDAAIALGGGVTGDMTGFASACYRRGIDYVQIPTTLLAAVDSSVGGKTAVDLPEGKNLVGAFHQPSLVICDTDTFSTLPEDIFTEGCGEVIKYGLLADSEFFYELFDNDIKDNIEDVITKCVSMKRDIVNEDEFDTGKRALLNLGHTFGHAVEALSRYQMLHGCAVAIGMMMVTRAAVYKGMCSRDAYEELKQLLEKNGLPTETNFTAEDILRVTLSDKKIKGKGCDLIVPEDVGKCVIHNVPVDSLYEWISLGLGKRGGSNDRYI